MIVRWKIPKEEKKVVTMGRISSNNLQVSGEGHVLKAKHMYGKF